MYTKRIRYTAGALLAATAAMAVSAGPLAQAAPVVVAPAPAVADSALSASIDPSVIAMQPQSLADMAQHALDAGVAGAAGALAARATGFRTKAASSGSVASSPSGTADVRFDAPTN
ncbi:hypothetical protein ACXPWS_28980 [Mycobacterium sp. BMJ-28]